MCFSKQPEAPINKPAYAPEDAHKHFQYDVSDDEGEKVQEPEVEPQTSKATGPKIKTTNDSIRM